MEGGMIKRRLRIVLVVVGFVVASAVSGVLLALIEDRTGHTWVRWPLMAVVIVPAVYLLLRYVSESGLRSVRAGEQAWLASVPFAASTSLFGRIARIGGVVVLGPDALTFRPWGRVGRTRRYPLDSIVAVEKFADRPPRLRLGLDDGRAAVFAVFATSRSTIWSRDTTARDEALGEIGSRLDVIRRNGS
jgi:hypothetical protein